MFRLNIPDVTMFPHYLSQIYTNSSCFHLNIFLDIYKEEDMRPVIEMHTIGSMTAKGTVYFFRVFADKVSKLMFSSINFSDERCNSLGPLFTIYIIYKLYRQPFWTQCLGKLTHQTIL